MTMRRVGRRNVGMHREEALGVNVMAGAGYTGMACGVRI